MYRSSGLHKFATAALALALFGSALAGCGGEVTPTTGAGGATGGEATATTATGGATGGEATATTAMTGGEATATTGGATGGTGGTGGVSDKYKGTTLNIVMANHAWN